MSDTAYFTATTSGDGLGVMRDNVEAGLGAARVKTVVSASSGPQTLAADADIAAADCSGGSFTWNLPASPADGDHYEFVLVSATGTLTIGRNGNNINGAAADDTLSTQWASRRLTWLDSESTWWSR